MKMETCFCFIMSPVPGFWDLLIFAAIILSFLLDLLYGLTPGNRITPIKPEGLPFL